MARKAIKKITVVARAKTEFMSAFLRSSCTAYGLNARRLETRLIWVKFLKAVLAWMPGRLPDTSA